MLLDREKAPSRSKAKSPPDSMAMRHPFLVLSYAFHALPCPAVPMGLMSQAGIQNTHFSPHPSYHKSAFGAL